MTKQDDNIGPALLSGMPDPGEFIAMGQKGIQEWLERVQSEAGLTAEFVNKFTTARSLSEAATAYQDWVSRRMQMAAEDGQRLLSNGQKLMEAGAKYFANGRTPGGST